MHKPTSSPDIMAQVTTVSQEKLVAACEEAINHLVTSLFPHIGDTFFARQRHTKEYAFTCQGLDFKFSQSNFSTSAQHSYIGYTIDFLDWGNQEGTRKLYIWLEHPQADGAVNRRAATTCALDLLNKVKKNVVAATADARTFIEAE